MDAMLPAAGHLAAWQLCAGHPVAGLLGILHLAARLLAACQFGAGHPAAVLLGTLRFEGRSAEVDEVLAEMRERGIEPNERTRAVFDTNIDTPKDLIRSLQTVGHSTSKQRKVLRQAKESGLLPDITHYTLLLGTGWNTFSDESRKLILSVTCCCCCSELGGT